MKWKNEIDRKYTNYHFAYINLQRHKTLFDDLISWQALGEYLHGSL